MVLRCPKCGYEVKPGEPVTVWDKNDMVARVTADEQGRLSDPDWKMSEIWDNKERICCPRCGKESPMRKWGAKWNWE